jgi:protein-disulfide isomerase
MTYATQTPPPPGPAPGSVSERVRRRPAQRRRRRRVLLAIVVAMVAGVVLMANHFESAQQLASPHHVLGPGDSEVEGLPSARVLVEMYGDYQCPYCHQFHAEVGQTIASLVSKGTVRFAFHPYAFIGPESIAAASAAECAGDEGRYFPMLEQLYNHTFPENSGGLTTAELIALARAAGVTGNSTLHCIRSATYSAWVQKVTDEASARGVSGTPTIFVNGVQDTDTTLNGFLQAVHTAMTA